MKTPTTREIFEAMHAAPKAPAPISGPVLGGGAVGVKSVLFERVKEAREAGKRLGLVMRSEHADPYYTTPFLVSLYEKEGGALFDARPSILGHIVGRAMCCQPGVETPG